MCGAGVCGAGGGAGCGCARRPSPLWCVCVCVLLLAYNAVGAFVFLALEGARGEGAVAASQPRPDHELRASTVERLWAITEDLNILYRENWTKLAAAELAHFQRQLVRAARPPHHAPHAAAPPRWTFATSFLYALTLITTIGGCGVCARSALGRVAALVYAAGGVPLVVLYLATLGGAAARGAQALYARALPTPPPPPRLFTHCYVKDAAPRTPFQQALNLEAGAHSGVAPHPLPRVPAALSALALGAYVALGALLFHHTERWSLLDGCYFSFASLATIGFGELRPGLYASTVSPRAEDAAIGACCAYILVGIVVVAACFNLLHERLAAPPPLCPARAAPLAEAPTPRAAS